MNNVYLRSKYSIKNISIYIILSLIPLLIAGFYKNGIKLYHNNLVGIYGLLKPLLITISGFIIGALINILYETLVKKSKDSFINKVFSSFHPVYGLITASIISINTNIFLFISVTFIIFFISKFLKNSKINIIALSALLIIFIINLYNNFTFLNVYESSKEFSLSAFDYLIGRGSGGINATYGILLLISLILLGSKDYYKISIPLYSFISFIILISGFAIYKNNLSLILDTLFSNSILFSFIYVAAEPLSSSYTNRGKFIYGILIGVFTFIFFLIEPTLAVLGAILISSILHNFIDKLCLK